MQQQAAAHRLAHAHARSFRRVLHHPSGEQVRPKAFEVESADECLSALSFSISPHAVKPMAMQS